jgi:hypothetical protein
MKGIVDEMNGKHTGFGTADIEKLISFSKRLIGSRSKFIHGGNAAFPRFPCTGLARE